MYVYIYIYICLRPGDLGRDGADGQGRRGSRRGARLKLRNATVVPGADTESLRVPPPCSPQGNS